tara:strand:+ start:1827 stop:2318 length:492 start_codon:yes stop_codon:yes gene_type:complete
MDIRVGNGYDTHPLVKGESFILGGVNIAYHKGIKGHSDGDVLVHSIIDALLGATNLGDIGEHFPSNDSKYKNVSSLNLLSHVLDIIHAESYTILNLDSTILLEKPIIKDYVPSMKKTIASKLLISIDRVSIKATTNDSLGFIGEEKGISAISTVLVQKGLDNA